MGAQEATDPSVGWAIRVMDRQFNQEFMGKKLPGRAGGRDREREMGTEVCPGSVCLRPCLLAGCGGGKG